MLPCSWPVELAVARLARSNNTLATAARLLGVSRPTLYGLMEVHGIEIEGMKPATPGGVQGATDTMTVRTEAAKTE